VRHALWGMLREALPSRHELLALLEAMRALRNAMHQRCEAMDRRCEAMRQDMHQRCEAMRQDMDQRCEAMDRRFEAVLAALQDQTRQLRETTLPLSALGSRVGVGLEPSVQEVVEACAGQTLPSAERLVLHDEAGEVYGVAGAEVECDLSAHHGVAYLVEVTSHLRRADVLLLYRQVRCAEGQLGRPVKPLIIALSMESQAERTMRQLGILSRVRATMDR